MTRSIRWRPTTRRSSPRSKESIPRLCTTAGVRWRESKVVKQSYDVLPKIIKGGGDGVYGASLLKGAGYPAVEGWYATIAAPYLAENPDVAPWIKKYEERYGHGPTSYSFTAYDGMLVVLDAIERVAA